jgi:hydroxypyruvate reductase
VIAAATTAETRGAVDGRVLDALGPEGVLVNICRDIVDEAALIAALQARRIRAAAIDVFATEPQVPPAFLALDNVVLTSHIGSATHASRRAMADSAIANLSAHFAGRPVPNPAPAGGH